ncbi:MAG: hypothetical protein ACTSV1_01260 [Alphaproteobacteria bacterium]
MASKRIANTKQYEAALKEFAELHTDAAHEANSRLNELTDNIDEFESRVWTDDLFGSLSGKYA